MSEARDKELTDIESLRRAEAKGNVKGAQDRIQKKMEKAERLDEKILGLQERVIENRNKIDIARSAIPKPTDMIMYARSYLESARAKGDSKTPDSVLLIQGMSAFNKEKGQEAAKLAGISSVAATTAGGQDTTALTRVVSEVNSILTKRGPLRDEYRNAQDLDETNAEKNKKNPRATQLPTDNARQYREDLIDTEFERYRSSKIRNPRAPEPPAAAPAATRSAAPPVAPRTTYTAADVEATANKSGKSKQQVIDAYRARGMELQK